MGAVNPFSSGGAQTNTLSIVQSLLQQQQQQNNLLASLCPQLGLQAPSNPVVQPQVYQPPIVQQVQGVTQPQLVQPPQQVVNQLPQQQTQLQQPQQQPLVQPQSQPLAQQQLPPQPQQSAQSAPQSPTGVAPQGAGPSRSRPRGRHGAKRPRSRSPSPLFSELDYNSEDYAEDEPEPDPEDEISLSYRERLAVVYRLLEDKLPPPPQSRPVVRSVADDPAPSSTAPPLPEALPWSPAVASAISSLQSFLQPSADPTSSRSLGHRSQRRSVGKYLSLPESGVSGRFYKFLDDGSPSFPSFAPLPEDGLADVCDGPFVAAPEVRLPYKAAVDLEQGLRRLVGIASHADWLSAASLRAAGELEGASSQLSPLLQSWNRANSDLVQLASWAVANLLLARRDAFARSFSQDLPVDRRTWLRTQSLSSSLLFGGRVDDARDLCRDNRRDRAFSSVLTSARQGSSSASRFSPSSASKKRRKGGAPSSGASRGRGSSRGGGRGSHQSRRGGRGAGRGQATPSGGSQSSKA